MIISYDSEGKKNYIKVPGTLRTFSGNGLGMAYTEDDINAIYIIQEFMTFTGNYVFRRSIRKFYNNPEKWVYSGWHLVQQYIEE